MSNHDVPRHPSRYGLPQVHSNAHHQLAKDWILRDGTSYVEDRELGAKRARAAIMMESGLPGSVYIYQGEELGLPEVADIPWDHLQDPTPFFTRERFIEKGRDGCRVPLPWTAADKPAPASYSDKFGEGASFGFSPATRPDGTPAADPHLPQPLWYADYAADTQEGDPTSMLGLYRTVLDLRQRLLTSTGDTAATMLDMGNEVVAYERTAADGKHFVSVTNFGATPVALPEGEVVLASEQLPGDGTVPQDVTVWVMR